MNKLILFISLLFVTSCIATKPASNINKAENRIIKFNQGIKNQIDTYPSLVNKAFKVIVKDTVYIPVDSSDFIITLIKVDSLLTASQNYLKLINQRQDIIDSLINVLLKDYPIECQYIVTDLNNRIKQLHSLSKQYQLESTEWHSKYINAITNTVIGTYTDDKFVVNYYYSHGQVDISVKTQDKFIVVDKEEHNYNVKIKKNFWQDWKFYPFLLTLTAIFYFFGNIIFGFIKNIVFLVRKLIFKI